MYTQSVVVPGDGAQIGIAAPYTLLRRKAHCMRIDAPTNTLVRGNILSYAYILDKELGQIRSPSALSLVSVKPFGERKAET